MKKRKVILTVELESAETVKVLKTAVMNALENAETDVNQIQANVVQDTKP